MTLPVSSGEHTGSAAELERSISGVAVALFEPGTVEATLPRITQLALATIDGCDLAGIFSVENERVVTSAFSDRRVIELDALQFEADEGPCLDDNTSTSSPVRPRRRLSTPVTW